MRACLILPLVLTIAVRAQTWTQLPDFPGGARDDAASFTIGNRIYVGTGMDVGFQLTNDWWSFEIQTGTWSQVAAMPATPRQYCTGFSIADTGYVFGGVDGGGALAELWAYHPESDSWEPKNPIPSEARYACVAVTGFFWNAIVATGMLSSGAPTNQAWKYNAPSDAWEPIAPVPGPSRQRAACFLGAGGMVIAGGADSTFAPLNDVWSYPIWFETGQWYPEAPLPSSRFAADGSWGNARTVIGGAVGPGPTDVHADAWHWDESTWHALPVFAGGPRRGAVSASGLDAPWTSTVYFGTGSDNVQRYQDWWKLEFPTGIDEELHRQISIAPVPANATLHFSTEGKAWSVWQVWSLDSRMMMDGEMQGASTDISTLALPSGTFILRLAGLQGTASRRFIVVH